MSALETQALPTERTFPLAGVFVVFRRQRRGRRLGRELAGAFGLLALLLVLAAGIQSLFFGQVTPYTNDAVRFLLRWLTTECLAAALLLPIAGAVLGAGAVPAGAERDSIQATLLTHLTGFEIATGRLLAALWSPGVALLLSWTFWTAIRFGFPFTTGSGNGFLEIAAAHLIVLSVLFASGAVGFLFALRRSGRSRECGTAVALLLLAFCVSGLVLFNPLVRKMDTPTPLIESLLVINPVTSAASALNKDILRVPWIYSRTDAPEYPFTYPAPLATAGLFALIALTAQGITAVWLRRLYAQEK